MAKPPRVPEQLHSNTLGTTPGTKAVWIEIVRSFHQLGTVQEKVRERDLVSLWDGTTRRRSLAERKLLEGAKVCTSEFRYIGAAPVVL